MKKIIRFLANISGVENDIRRDERIGVGHMMNSDRYWWTGGSLGKPKYDCYNAFFLYAKRLISGYGTDISAIREEVYKIGDKYHPES